MEKTEKPSDLTFKDSFEMPTLIQSPLAFNEKSTLDISQLSVVNTSAVFSPSPKSRIFDNSLSPIRSPFSVKSEKSRTKRSHSALEEKLLKIEIENSKNQKPEKVPYPSLTSLKIAEYLEDGEEGSYSRRIVEVPRLAWCAFCGGERMTLVKYVNDSKTFWSSIGIFLSGGIFGCFLLPYMTNSCKGIQTVCSQCGRTVG
jgi:hypothetical protein